MISVVNQGGICRVLAQCQTEDLVGNRSLAPKRF